MNSSYPNHPIYPAGATHFPGKISHFSIRAFLADENPIWQRKCVAPRPIIQGGASEMPPLFSKTIITSSYMANPQIEAELRG
jgi:hypothetical protein